MIEPLLLAVCRVSTYHGERRLTNASSFFFQRDHRLFLVTSRHVMIDDPSQHYPTRLQVELHTDAEDMAQSTGFSIPLYEDGKSLWRQGIDAGGEIDVAVIEIDRSALPEGAVYRAFGPANLLAPIDQVEVGSSLLIVGFPLGFHDTLHHMPVVRHAVIASSFGLRFKGEGYFLTDARTHRGTSGAPVVLRAPVTRGMPETTLQWLLLGVHSSRIDVGTRDQILDEALGLNGTWYTDILMTLTEK